MVRVFYQLIIVRVSAGARVFDPQDPADPAKTARAPNRPGKKLRIVIYAALQSPSQKIPEIRPNRA